MITTVLHKFIKPIIYFISYLALLLVCTGLDVKVKQLTDEAHRGTEKNSRWENHQHGHLTTQKTHHVVRVGT
jgi:hypothetical protein